MWELKTVPNIYVDNCSKTRDNTCKNGRLRQLGIPALTSNKKGGTSLMKHSLLISRARLIAASFKFLIYQLSMVI